MRHSANEQRLLTFVGRVVQSIVGKVQLAGQELESEADVFDGRGHWTEPRTAATTAPTTHCLLSPPR